MQFPVVGRTTLTLTVECRKERIYRYIIWKKIGEKSHVISGLKVSILEAGETSHTRNKERMKV